MDLRPPVAESTARFGRANRRFIRVALVAFLAFFVADAYLFRFEGFLALFGRATQEGQILSKVRRAERLAHVADIILFGSSYVRSGVAGEPFLAHGVLPFNFAASGGGPVYDYFALSRIAPMLATRDTKPVLAVELKTDALLRVRNSAWSEYPQYLGIVRTRAEMLAHAPMLWRQFRDFGMTSQFLSGLLLPSSIYRSYAVQILATDASLDGYFYGMEDFSGFAPLYSRAHPSSFPRLAPAPPLPIEEFFPGKLEFLRAFLRLARDVGCPVVLYASPTVLLGSDDRVYDDLIAALQTEFAGLVVMRTGDYGLQQEDFDEGGHLNIRGADRMSEHLVRTLNLVGDAARLPGTIAEVFDVVPVPAVGTWSRDTARVEPMGSHEIHVRAVPGETPDLARSLPIPVQSGREYVLELELSDVSGRLTLSFLSRDPATGALFGPSFVTPEEPGPLDGHLRVMLRLEPRVDQVEIAVGDFGLATGGAPAAARVRVLRLWAD